jgi:hypothetical protein
MTRPLPRRWKTPAVLLAATGGLALGITGWRWYAAPAIPLAPAALPAASTLPPALSAVAARREGAALVVELWADLDPAQAIRVRLNGRDVAHALAGGCWNIQPGYFIEGLPAALGRAPMRLRVDTTLDVVRPDGTLEVDVETAAGSARRVVRVDPGAVPPAIVGQTLDVEWRGTWYAGTAVESRNGQLLIRYVGYDEVWNEWVPAWRLRSR